MKSKSFVWIVAGILLMLVLVQGVQAVETYNYLTQWGTTGSGNGQFLSPAGVAVDYSGNVYVSDYYNTRIQKFYSSGSPYLLQWGTYGTGDGQFYGPTGVTVDYSSSNVYVADASLNRVQKFTSTGTFITKWGTPGSGDGQFQNPWAVATDMSGNVYVVEYSNNRVQKFTSAGAFITKWGTTGSGDGQFTNPSGIAVEPVYGNVYIMDSGNNRIQKFTSTGTFITKWGTSGSGDGQFNNPRGIAEYAGYVYVSDTNNRVQKFTSTGTFITKWGTPGSGDGQFSNPLGIAVDYGSSYVYVVDTSNNRVQEFYLYIPPPPAPVAAFHADHTSGTASLDVTFTDDSTNYPTSWYWNFGDGTYSSLQAPPPHTYSVGTYTVTLTVSNAGGTDVINKINYITVSPPVPPVADFYGTPLTSGPAPLNVTFTDASSGAPTGWAWFFGDESYNQAWTQQSGSAGWTAGSGSDSVVLPDGSIVLVRNGVWRSTDQGISWAPVNPSPGFSDGDTVVMPDGTMLHMNYGGGIPHSGEVWKSTDKGTTWTPVTMTTNWDSGSQYTMVEDCVALPDGTILLTYYHAMAGDWTALRRSTDQGVTWTSVVVIPWGPRTRFDLTAMPDGNVIMTGGTDMSGGYYNDVWMSINNGTTWTQQTANAGWTARYDHSCVAMPDGSIVLMGGYGSSIPGRDEVWRSTDNGATWTLLTASAEWPARMGAASVAMPDGSIVLMGGRSEPAILPYNDAWRFNPIGSSEQGPFHDYTVPGIYNVALQARNTGGYSSKRIAGYITVNAPTPTLTVTSIYPNAAENTRSVSITDLSGTGFDPTGATVKLTQAGQTDIPATNIGYASSEKLTCDFDLTGKATGHWDVVVTSPPGGDTATLINGFTVTAPTPAPRIAAFTFDATNMLNVQFTDTSTGGSHTRLWDFGDGATDTTNPTTHAYSSPGTYPVTLTATYSGPSYSDSERKPVTVVGITRVVAKSDEKVGVLAHPNEETKTSSLNPVSANYKVKLTREDESFTTPAKPGYVVAKHALRRNGDGPTDYYFVDSNGEVTPLGTKNSLPLNVVIEAEDPYSETNGVTTEQSGGGGVGLGALALIPKCGSSCANNYALLVDGGKSADDNHIRYWNDIAFMYQTLNKTYGYPKANIKVLMSDGTANSPDDRHISTVGGVAQKDNSPRDLDSDGTDESTISGIDSATKTHLTGALSTLNNGKTSSNSLFIFTTGHGAEDPAYTTGTGHVIYNLWNGETITDTEFVNALPANFGSITIMMEQCYGGGFIDNFIPDGYSDTTQKRIIHTAANPYEPSYGNGYSNVWTRGVAMITDNRAPTNEAEVGTYGNNDGYVAMSEICLFATAADPANSSSLAHFEHPQCQNSTNAAASTKYLTSGNWISSPSVIVASPNSAETWSRGYARKITWNSKNIANVKIELYNSSSGQYYQLASSTAAAARYWNWNPIPTSTVTGTQIYKVRISNSSNANTNDMSDQYFTIQSASPGTLTYSVLPAGAAGATITLDGDATVASGSSVSAGTHTLTAKKTGYLDQTKGYNQLTTGTQVPFTLDEIGTNERSDLPNSATDAGTMVITSTPMGAEVWIAEGSGAAVLKGTTPFEQAIIPGTNWKDNYPHKYTVTVKSVGYKPAVPQDVKVGKGQTASADFVLEPTFSVGAITQTPIPSAPIQLKAPPTSSDFSAPITYTSGGPHTATWNWDDGSTSAGFVTESGGSGTITGSHPYTTTGVNTVTLTVTDTTSGVVQISTYQYAVVYDPYAGYVVGVGSIASPAGAYKYDPSPGTAYFGFVSKYVRGKSVPQGVTEFYFHEGSMNFFSTSYDWLVINSPRATYKGTGQINGQGNYKFTLTAIDGNLKAKEGGKVPPDKFRIRITDMAEKERVYDNMLDVDGDTEPTTVLKCGFIMIQK